MERHRRAWAWRRRLHPSPLITSSHPGSWQLPRPPAWASLVHRGAHRSGCPEGTGPGADCQGGVSLAELGSPGERWDEVGKPDQATLLACGRLQLRVPSPTSRPLHQQAGTGSQRQTPGLKAKSPAPLCSVGPHGDAPQPPNVAGLAQPSSGYRAAPWGLPCHCRCVSQACPEGAPPFAKEHHSSGGTALTGSAEAAPRLAKLACSCPFLAQR